MKSFEVKNIEQFFKAVLSSTILFKKMFWWRGQANLDWKVVPSLYHKGKHKDEFNMIHSFMNHALVRRSNVPNKDDLQGWLFLMQHFGLPTRLLDWSNSPLVALYFAIREELFSNKNGVVWGLQPAALNADQVEIGSVLTLNHHKVLPFFANAFSSSGQKDIKKILAISSQHIDTRQLLQASEFTIHGYEQPLNELSQADKFMVRIIIPVEAKPKLKESLRVLNITESQLFPDLDHLAIELENTRWS